MWRIAFLVLVLVGALAVAIGLVVGVGAMQIARTNSSASPTTEPAAVGSATQPTVATAPVSGPGELIPPPDVMVLRPDPAAQGVPPVVPPKVVVTPLSPVKEPVKLPLAVTGLVLAKADGLTPIVLLTEGMTLDLAALPTQKYTIVAQVTGEPKSVRFRDQLGNNVQGSTTHIENAAPWTINGDGNNKAEPYALKAGDHLLAAAPYSSPDGAGNMGQFLHLKLKVIDSKAGPIQLLASQATLKGEQIRLEGEGDDRAAAFWHDKSDAIYWQANIAKPGMYRVELTYSCDPQAGGGSFTVFLNSRQFGGVPTPTQNWQDYRALEVGQLALKEGDLKIVIKPSKMRDGKALMNVRALKLVPID